MSELPPGFVLDQQQSAPPPGALPPGFALDQPQQGVLDKLLGRNGPRFQMWPERMVREALTIPQRATEEAGRASIGADYSIAPIAEAATLGSPVNPAMRAGDRLIPGIQQSLRTIKPVVPTTQELAASGKQAMNAARDSGLEVAPEAIAGYSQKVQRDLYEAGIHPIDAPATYAKLRELENAPPGSFVTASNIKSLRDSLGVTAQNFNPNAAKDQLAASRAIKGLDEFVPNVPEASVLAGTPATTGKLFERGRGDYAAAQRSNDITGNLDRARTGIIERAEGRAQAANSGRNLDNTIRQKVESVLEKPKELSGLNDAEIAALERVVQGGAGRNTARYVGNVLGGGGGIGQSLVAALGGGIGASVGGIPGAIVGTTVPAAGGAISKSIANALARRDLAKADELIRKRSPLYQERVENPDMAVVSPERRAAIIRALILQQQQ